MCRGTTPGTVRQYGYDSLCMELWAHRTIDNHAASPIGLHIVEGIYGRDGDFNWGESLGSEDSKILVKSPIKEGRAWDYMTNIVIFGKEPLPRRYRGPLARRTGAGISACFTLPWSEASSRDESSEYSCV